MNKLPLDKILGTLLLTLGLLVIFYSGVSVYKVFNGLSKPFNLFAFSAVNVDLGKVVNPDLPAGEFKQEIFEADVLNKPMNLIGHIVLMGFIASVGFKVASLGVMLVRTINVQIREDKPKTML